MNQLLQIFQVKLSTIVRIETTNFWLAEIYANYDQFEKM